MTNYIGLLVSSLLNEIFYLSQKISRVYIILTINLLQPYL